MAAVFVGLLVAAYVLGAIPFSWLVARARGVDLRTVGSGNIGAANVWRSCGFGPFLAAMSLDVTKGLLPTLLATRWAGLDAWSAVAVGVAAIVGHTWSVFLGLRGGKAVATSGGVLIALVPRLALLGVLIWGLTFALTRYSSVGSLVAAGGCALAALALLVQNALPVPYALFVLGACALIVYLHRSNIARLRAGTENRFVGMTKDQGPRTKDQG